MDVVVAGSHGLIGTALVAELRRQGHTVRRLVRSDPRGPDELRWDPDGGHLDPGALAGADAVVNLAGAGAGDHRLTASYRRTVLQSRTRTTSLISTTLAGLPDGPRILLQASAIGAYGDRGTTVLDESSARGDTFLAEVVRRWEASTAEAEAAGIRVAHLRSGIVLTPRGGALGRMLPIVRAGLGGRLGSGRQFWSWITLADEVGAILHLLTAPVSGPVNVTSPHPTPQVDVVRQLGRALHRPTVVPVPAFALRIALGEFSREVLGSVRAVPRVLLDAGYVFRHPTAADAAAWVAAGAPVPGDPLPDDRVAGT